MDKLSNYRLYEVIMQELDKHQTVYYEAYQVSDFFNDAYMEWLNAMVKNLEADASSDIKLLPLVRTASVANSSIVNLSQLSPKFYHSKAVFADFDFVCRGVSKTWTRGVNAISYNNLQSVLDDANKSPTNHFPLYLLTSEYGYGAIKILSSTTPKMVTVNYIQSPSRVDMENNPNGFTEIDFVSQMEVVSICVLKILETIKNTL